MATLVDKSTNVVAAPYDAIPNNEGGRQRGPWKTLLFNTACGLAPRVLPTKLVKLDRDIHPYLTVLMFAILTHVGEALVVPESMEITIIMRKAFIYMLLKEASYNFNSYWLVIRQVL